MLARTKVDNSNKNWRSGCSCWTSAATEGEKRTGQEIPKEHLNVSLLEACRKGREFVVQKLVRSGIEVNVKGNCFTLLHVATERNFVDIADFLLDKEVDVGAIDHHGNTALILAVTRAGCSDMLNLLLACRANVDYQNSQKAIDLMRAIELWILAQTQTEPTGVGRRPFFLDMSEKDLGSVKQQVNTGANLEACNSEWWTPLLPAARCCHTQVVELLKDCGANMKWIKVVEMLYFNQ
ncbi:hypothetical protein EGW08_019491 [Elysia chlorotica]|uniref:Uncharacterized protein n=1 Tax=Elysia chlorotica TaxID=188477 RepID=A0A433SU92_ELYCH|nr:hypothetical protein EGW08_019491 [Elysia chlorotica]